MPQEVPEYFDHVERARLCDLLEALGPGAPTLISPWATRDLAAHLILRERDALAAPGLVAPGPWGRFAARRQDALAAQDFDRLVRRLRSGPPPGFFRIGWVRAMPSLNEFFVHQEDARRANGLGPRAFSPAMDEALWSNVRRGHRLLARRLRHAGLELHWSGTDRAIQPRPRHPAARLSGAPGELLLYLFGRQSAAEVTLTGPDAATSAVRRTRFGM